MARETDFLDLYRSLGIEPGCGLTDFKQAYRRRVAVLHPDRRPAEQFVPAAADDLQRLTALYGEAMEFHRSHGRLPGATAQRPFDMPGPAAQPAPPPARTSMPSRPGLGRLTLLVTSAVALWLWFGPSASPPEQSAAPSTPSPASASVAALDTPEFVPSDAPGNSAADPLVPPGKAAALEYGIPRREVRAIEGEPMLINGDIWEYGPSWIRFEDNKVVGWYSSPLRPLKTAVTHHPGDTQD